MRSYIFRDHWFIILCMSNQELRDNLTMRYMTAWPSPQVGYSWNKIHKLIPSEKVGCSIWTPNPFLHVCLHPSGLTSKNEEKKYYITLGKTTRTDILPARLGSSQKRICLNRWILRLPSTTELISHMSGSKYHTCSQTFIWKRTSTQKLDLVNFLLKFGCPGQMGNHFYSPPVIFIMFKSFLITKMHLKQFWIFDDILKHFYVSFGHFFQNMVVTDKWANILNSPPVILIMFKSFLKTKMHIKTILDFWWYSKIFSLFFGHFFQNLVVPDNWANIFDSPLVTFIMFKSFLIAKCI